MWISNSLANRINLKTGKKIYTMGLKDKTAGAHAKVDNLPPSAKEIVKKVTRILNEKNNFFYNKRILVAGGTGLVGQPLVEKLLKLKSKVYVASKDNKKLSPKGIKKFYQTDLTKLNNCIKVTKNIDIVFNLLGITGSPLINNLYPARFMMSNLNLALNLLEASRINKVKNYLFTSTYGVYGPDKPMKEENVWKSFPSEHDKYAGWAKRIAELQVEAYRKEFKFNGLHVVRPGNIFGPYSNFNPKNSMVVSSLIKRVTDGEIP